MEKINMKKNRIMKKGQYSLLVFIILIICFIVFFFVYLNKDIISLDKHNETPRNISEEIKNVSTNKVTNKTNHIFPEGVEIPRRGGG
jgi:preprotein translocase subunit SecF